MIGPAAENGMTRRLQRTPSERMSHLVFVRVREFSGLLAERLQYKLNLSMGVRTWTHIPASSAKTYESLCALSDVVVPFCVLMRLNSPYEVHALPRLLNL